MSYAPTPGTLAYRVLGWLEAQPSRSAEFNTAQLAEALGVQGSSIQAGMESAIKHRLVFRRQKDRTHPRSPLWYSLTDHDAVRRQNGMAQAPWMGKPGSKSAAQQVSAEGVPTPEAGATPAAPPSSPDELKTLKARNRMLDAFDRAYDRVGRERVMVTKDLFSIGKEVPQHLLEKCTAALNALQPEEPRPMGGAELALAKGKLAREIRLAKEIQQASTTGAISAGGIADQGRADTPAPGQRETAPINEEPSTGEAGKSVPDARLQAPHHDAQGTGFCPVDAPACASSAAESATAAPSGDEGAAAHADASAAAPAMRGYALVPSVPRQTSWSLWDDDHLTLLTDDDLVELTPDETKRLARFLARVFPAEALSRLDNPNA